jgi:hypothetical protein
MNRLVLTAAMVAALGEPLTAQGRGRNVDGVPPGHRPPGGMCRVWIDAVPPGRQPAPSDCAAAVRNRPANGRVIYGDDSRYTDDGWGKNKRKDKDRDKDKWKSSDRDDRRYGRDGRDDDDNRDWDRRRRDERGQDCVDRDRNGRCDYIGQGSDYCLDRNHDGRCDYVTGIWGSGQQMPDMIRSVLLDRGQRSADQRRWLGNLDVHGRYTDWDRNGVPERISWLDSAGRVVQQWVDNNRDGRADAVRLYQAGELVRVVQR